jgi:hypothetical protein
VKYRSYPTSASIAFISQKNLQFYNISNVLEINYLFIEVLSLKLFKKFVKMLDYLSIIINFKISVIPYSRVIIKCPGNVMQQTFKVCQETLKKFLEIY